MALINQSRRFLSNNEITEGVLKLLFSLTTLHLIIITYQKSLYPAKVYSSYEYKHTYHLVCSDNSYYSNAHAALCCMGVCVMASYWEERG